jgi:hypothetical protein
MSLADAHVVEVGDRPMQLFLAKAFGNGKTTALAVRGRANDALNNYLAELVQGYPHHVGRLPAPIQLEGLTAPAAFTPGRRQGRLLYAISEYGQQPTFWWFDNGYAQLRYRREAEPVLERFRGSKYVADRP